MQTRRIFAQTVTHKYKHPSVWSCHAKIDPPVIGLAGPILAEIFAKNWSPGPLFAATICPARPVLAAKTGPPCQVWSPCKIHESVTI